MKEFNEVEQYPSTYLEKLESLSLDIGTLYHRLESIDNKLKWMGNVLQMFLEQAFSKSCEENLK